MNNNNNTITKNNAPKIWPKLPKLPQTPFVSICTPTFNRRPFIPYIIKCIEYQTYPKDNIEWIIVDDGTDPIYDLVKDLPYVKYIGKDKLNLNNEKLTLGRKRNIMHNYAKGDIIIYMDDDDYYPPERISHAVKTLKKNPKAWIAGSSEMHIYFKHVHKMYKFGPYNPIGPFKCSNHSTAATFAFRKELLEHTKYNDDACLAEEKQFLMDYKVPLIQLDPKKTILVFSHNHNSFDKKKLLNDVGKISGSDKVPMIVESSYDVDDFIKSEDLKQFYMNDIDEKLKDYYLGDISNKPDVILQMKEIEKKRDDIIKMRQQQQFEMFQRNAQINDSINKILEYNKTFLKEKRNPIEIENNDLYNKIIELSKKLKSINKEKYDLEIKTYNDIYENTINDINLKNKRLKIYLNVLQNRLNI